MLLLVLKISSYCGSFPYVYDARKKQFVYSKLGFITLLNTCFFTVFSFSGIVTNFYENGWIYFVSRLITLSMVTFLKLSMLFSLKTKLNYYNKVLELYLEDGADRSGMSLCVFVNFILLIVSSCLDYAHFWFSFERRAFLWRLTTIPNRLMIWSLSFQFVAVSIFLRRQFELLNFQLRELLQGDFKNDETNSTLDRLNKFSYKCNEFYSSYNSPNAFNMVLDGRSNHYTFPEDAHRKEILFIHICRKCKALKANVKALNDLYSNTILFLTVAYLEFINVSINNIIKTMAQTSAFTKVVIIKLFYFFVRAVRSIALLMYLYQTCSSIEDEVLRSAKIIIDSNLKRSAQSFLNLIVSFLHSQHVDRTSFTIVFGHIGVNLELALLFMAGITPLITISIQTYYYTNAPARN